MYNDFKAKEQHPQNYKTFFGYWKDDGIYKRKSKGRADYDGSWSDIKDIWLTTYFNREEIPGFSVKKEVCAKDEWCADAYMKTDYSKLKRCNFENIIKDYAISKIKNGISSEVSPKSLYNKKLEYDINEWKEFYITDLFKVTGSKSIVKYDVVEYGKGIYPYVVTSSENNGVEGLIMRYLLLQL